MCRLFPFLEKKKEKTMINWHKINHFTAREFPEDPDKHATPDIIYAVDGFRGKLGKRVYPSKAKGALARFTGNVNTQHYAVGRKSTAVDFFCEGTPLNAFHMMLISGAFNGIGVYLDTTGNDGHPWVMFHGDIRKVRNGVPKIWVVEKVDGKDMYRYPQRFPQYWSLFKDQRMYTPREFIVDHR